MILNNAPELKKIPPFAGLPEPAQQYLQSRLRRYDFSKGDPIITSGKRGAFFAIVGKGTIILQEPNGETQTLMPGGMFGEGMLRFGVPSSFSARAQSDTSLWVIKRSDWIAANEIPRPENKIIHTKFSSGQKPVQYWLLPIFVAFIFLITVVLMLGPSVLSFTHETITNIALETNRLDLAQEYFELVLQVQPNSARLYDYLGYLLYLQNKPVQARAILEKALNLDSSLASLHNNLGVILLDQGEISEAIIHLEEAVLLDPTSSNAYLNLANAYLKYKDYESALANYQKAYEIDPNQIDAKALWASAALEIGQTTAAQEVWKDVLTINPNHPLANQGIGVIESFDRNFNAALPYLQSAILENPENPVTHYYLGVTWQALGNKEESIAEFEAVLDLSKDPELLQRAKQQLQQLKD